jgi:hypothetical protein
LDKDFNKDLELLMDGGQYGTETSPGKLTTVKREEALAHMDINQFIWPDKTSKVILI